MSITLKKAKNFFIYTIYKKISERPRIQAVDLNEEYGGKGSGSIT